MTDQPTSAARALSVRRVTPTVATMLLLGVLSLSTTADAQEALPSPKAHGPALFAEPGFMTSALDWAGRFSSDDESGDGKTGFYPKVGGMVTGAGWLAVGPGYRTHLSNGRAALNALA